MPQGVVALIVYRATNIVNNKIYIGKTTYPLSERIMGHVYSAKRKSKIYFHRAIRKYGIDNFKFEVLFKCKNEKELSQIERQCIASYDATDYIYNLTSGGEGVSGFKHKTESRTKMSIAHKGKKLPMETRKKMSESRTGEKHPFYGKKLSDEHKKKISTTEKGKKMSEESRMKISMAQIGRKMSEDSIRKASISRTGQKRTPEQRERMRIARNNYLSKNNRITDCNG